MSEHVLDLLNAYQDGELQGEDLLQVKRHLKSCKHCQGELDQLKQLSLMLRATPPPPSRQTPHDFAARLIPLLPDRTQTISEKNMNWSWGWLALPVGLFTTGAILWASSWITGLLFLANQGGLLGNLGHFLPDVANQTVSLPAWYTLLQGILNENLATALLNIQATWNSLETIVFSLGGEALLALMYLTWLVLLWNKRPLLQSNRAKA
jgi:predicted anti-sigma-YlaC factor YlaD